MLHAAHPRACTGKASHPVVQELRKCGLLRELRSSNLRFHLKLHKSRLEKGLAYMPKVNTHTHAREGLLGVPSLAAKPRSALKVKPTTA